MTVFLLTTHTCVSPRSLCFHINRYYRTPRIKRAKFVIVLIIVAVTIYIILNSMYPMMVLEKHYFELLAA